MLPWIWATVTRSGSGIPPSPMTYFSRLGTFFSHVLPMILGLRVEGVGLWEGGHVFGAIAYALLIVFVLGSLILVVRRRDLDSGSLTLVLYPFLYAAFPTSWFWNDGRYGLSLTPILSLVIAGGLWQMMRPTGPRMGGFGAPCPRVRFHPGRVQRRLRSDRKAE